MPGRSLDGNLCRCTGYRPILQAFSGFARDPTDDLEQQAIAVVPDGAHPPTGVVEPPFPAALIDRPAVPLSLSSSSGNSDGGVDPTWHRPVTLEALLALRAELPAAKMVCGNTEVGIEVLLSPIFFSPPLVLSLISIMDAPCIVD